MICTRRVTDFVSLSLRRFSILLYTAGVPGVRNWLQGCEWLFRDFRASPTQTSGIFRLPKNRECHKFPWEYPPKCYVFFPLQFDLCRTVDVIFSRYGGIPNLIQLLIACYHVLIVWYIHIMRYNCTHIYIIFIYIYIYIRMWILYPDREILTIKLTITIIDHI